MSLFWVRKDQSISIGEHQLNYKISGSGSKDVLLIHGMFSSLYCWDLVASIPQNKYRFIAVDLPQMSESRFFKFVNPERHIEDIIKNFCKQLNLNQPHIVGCSLGGLVAYLAKVKYPQVFGKCIMVAPAFSPRFFLFPIKKLHAYRFHFLSPVLNLFTNPLVIGYAHLRTAGKNFRAYRAMSILSKFRRSSHFKASICYLHLINRSDENIGKLKQVEDYSIIWGTKDHLIRQRAFQSLRDKNPQLAYYVIPKALHHPMESHPKEFFNIMDQILNLKSQGVE